LTSTNAATSEPTAGRRDAHPVAGALQSDAAVQVVHAERPDDRERRHGEPDVQHVTPEGQVENVEPDVHAELRVLHAEVDPVGEQHPLLPVRLTRQPSEETDDASGQPGPQAHPGREEQPVALERLLLGGTTAGERAQAESQVHVAAHESADERPEDQEEPDLGTQHAAEDVGVADLLVPKPVRPQTDHLVGEDQKHYGAADDRQRDLAATAETGQRGSSHDHAATLVVHSRTFPTGVTSTR
jgi:hypothetical protein